MIALPPIAPVGAPRAQHAKRPQEMPLEGVRGIAAIMVGLSHLLYLDLLTPALKLPAWLTTVEGGHAGVLIFFVLSGYVIGWTNPEPFSPDRARSYVWRRFVRLVPIYVIAIALTVGIAAYLGQPEPNRIILGNLLGLQNFNGYFGYSLGPSHFNVPLWSLNFELVYYAMFILLWRSKPGLIVLFGPAALAAAMGWFNPQYMPLFISAYGCGWIFWATGWWLSQRPYDSTEAIQSHSALTWLFLVVAGHQIGGGYRILNALGLYANDAGMIPFADLGQFPAILLLLGSATRRNVPHRKWLELAAWTLCIVPVIGLIAKGRIFDQPSWLSGCCAIGLAAAFMPIRGTGWLKPWAWFGAISYAFYVVHYPLLYAVQSLPLPKATFLGLAERVPIWVGLSIGAAWMLERRFQPWIAARLRPKKVAS